LPRRKVLILGISISQSIPFKWFLFDLVQKAPDLSGAFCSLLSMYSEMDGIAMHIDIVDSMVVTCLRGLTGFWGLGEGMPCGKRQRQQRMSWLVSGLGREAGFCASQFAKCANCFGRNDKI
jgi:hypothetical protein